VAGVTLPVVVPGSTKAEALKLAPTPRTTADVPEIESTKVVPVTTEPAAELKDQRWVRAASACGAASAAQSETARTREKRRDMGLG
jgi:hypothetical protein